MKMSVVFSLAVSAQPLLQINPWYTYSATRHTVGCDAVAIARRSALL